jgi:predicted transcriptional regulator
MKTVILEVASLNESLAAFSRTWKTGKAEKEARISFATPELLWKTLTAKRWALLQVMAGAGAMSIRETARRAARDVKAVHGDVTALVKAGLLRRVEDGVEFPFDAVHVDFMLKAA